MSETIQYRSSRREVLGWYWRMWRQGVWKLHLLIFVAVAVGCYATSKSLIISAFMALAPIAWLWLYPQLRFKPQLRNLTVDSDGINTTIGRKHGEVPWSDISSVKEDEAGRLFIQRKNGNAFIIPPRAFHSDSERLAFFDLVRGHVG